MTKLKIFKFGKFYENSTQLNEHIFKKRDAVIFKLIKIWRIILIKLGQI